MIVGDKAGRHAPMADDMSRTRGTIEVSTSVADPPRVQGVKVNSGAGKIEPPTVGIVAKRATGKASVERRKQIWTRPNQVEPSPSVERYCIKIV